MRVPEIVHDLLVDRPAWQVEARHPQQAPKVDVISPALHHSFDGADMISLVLPPPSCVSFEISDADAPAILRARAGVDITVFKLLGERVPSATFRFQVAIDGEVRFSDTVTVECGAPRAGSDWIDVGGAEGLPVRAGDRVTLRCDALDPDGNVVDPEAVAFAGFGGLRLERRVSLPRSRSSPDAPNMVFVVIDTLRADRLATYGYARPTSPALDRLAARGTLFENAYSTASWTLPSTASMLTGLQPIEHGVENKGNFFLGWALSTLAEKLQRARVTTAAWSGNPLISKSRNFSQGFEEFHDHIADFRGTGTFFDEVERWLTTRGDTRFFLYLQLTEPHQPYTPLDTARALLAPDVPRDLDTGAIERRLEKGGQFDARGVPQFDALVPPDERTDVSDLYDACVWSADHWLGRLLDTLDTLGLTDRTVVVFTSDHGEELFERGYVGHARSLMNELVHVPLVIAGPGVPEGERSDALVSNRLVAPWLARLAGKPLRLPHSGPGLFDDRHGTPVLFSTEKGVWNGRHGMQILGMRTGDRVVQLAPYGAPWGADASEHDGDLRLYDLATDPDETTNLRQDGALQALRTDLERRFDALSPVFEGADLRVGDGTRYLLRRLGYAGQ